MPIIRTLNGDIAADTLGVTYSHDHIYCIPPYWKDRGEDDLLLDNTDFSLQELCDFKQAGGMSIYDATAPDYGRDAVLVAKLAKSCDVNVIGTTGFNKGFLWRSLKPGSQLSFQEHITQHTVAQLADELIKEVLEGIDDTHHRAGVVKFGTGYNQIHELERKTIHVIAHAAQQTGAPIHSHTEMGTMALEQIDILKQLNVDLSRVGFAHLDRNPDPWLLKKIANSGAFLSFDGVSRIKYHPEHIRSQALLGLVKAGFEKQILIGGDFARKSMSAHYGCGGLGMKFILASWVPRFIEEADAAGLDGRQLIQTFFIDNPQRYFSMRD